MRRPVGRRLTRTVAILLAGALYCGWAIAAEHTKDSLEVVKQKLADNQAVLVDVREQAEWDAGYLDQAVLLPLSTLRKNPSAANQLPKGKIVYTHCKAGVRSVMAGNLLERQGYDVRPLKAGYEDLLQAGFAPAKKK